jgi:SAM-dependent methyltransferase
MIAANKPHCTLCGGILAPLYCTPFEWAMMQCANCGSCQAFPEPNPTYLSSLYKEEYLAETRFWLDKNSRLADDYMLKLKALFALLPANARILEVGGAYGFFADLIRRQLPDARVLLLEMNSKAVAYARDVLGVDAVDASLGSGALSGQQFDLVFAGHVVEHFSSFKSFFGPVSQLLAPGGRLVCLLPNADSWRLRLFRHHWQWAAPEQHFQFLTARGARLLAPEYGLECEQTKALTPAAVHFPGVLPGPLNHLHWVLRTIQDSASSGLPGIAKLVSGIRWRVAKHLPREHNALRTFERWLDSKLVPSRLRDELYIVFRKP